MGKIRKCFKSKIRGKERKGFRGEKLRHSLWKAEYNKKWIKSEQEQLEYMCTKWDLDPNTFIVPTDEVRDLYANACDRCTEYLKANNWFEYTSKGEKTEQIKRFKLSKWKGYSKI